MRKRKDEIFFSFAHLGDGQNAWIADKSQGLPPPLDRTGVFYTGPILYQPYLTPALYYTVPILH